MQGKTMYSVFGLSEPQEGIRESLNLNNLVDYCSEIS